uniref:Uncharacterized protein n=1 Tax=uncultured delta proteobacterium HF0200_39N20 TaxID=710833 RepID=E0XUX0_9DELT|nr:hypothetical protein [uncultured delta proteobacterium HF0200_39N20]
MKSWINGGKSFEKQILSLEYEMSGLSCFFSLFFYNLTFRYFLMTNMVDLNNAIRN